MKLYEKESVENKLFRLKEIIRILEEIRLSPKKKFLDDYQLNSAGMFNLMIGITIILDIGQHLLARYTGKTAHEYKEVIKFLGEEKIVPSEFAEENIEMAKFRNLLVHEYDKIDDAQVYDFIQKAPDIFRSFAKYFVEFMEKQRE